MALTSRIPHKKVDKRLLVDTMADNLGCSNKDAEAAWAAAAKTIVDILGSGKSVNIPGVGTIDLRKSRQIYVPPVEVDGPKFSGTIEGGERGGNIVPRMIFSGKLKASLRTIDFLDEYEDE